MVDFLAISYNVDGSWSFSWTGAGTYNVVLNGTIIDTITGTSYNFTGPGNYASNDPPPLEVVPNTQSALSQLYQPYLIIQWYPVRGCQFYQIQSFDGTNWNNLATISEKANTVMYSYKSMLIPDGAVAEYRVMAVDQIGQQSAPIIFEETIVCPPSFPAKSANIGYNSSGTSITVTAPT
jgi:hypothetical protein